MKRLVILLFVCISYGCTAQLHTLMSLSSEQKEQRKYVAAQNKKFNLLLNDLKRQRLDFGKDTKEDIIKIYGEPITIKATEDKEVFLYRDPVDFFSSQKVYLFFDTSGILYDFKIESELELQSQD